MRFGVTQPAVLQQLSSILCHTVRSARMAGTTFILLPSPPSQSPIAMASPLTCRTMLSSSPGLPSPSQLYSTMPSHLPRDPETESHTLNAIVGFKSAASLLPEDSCVDEPQLVLGASRPPTRQDDIKTKKRPKSGLSVVEFPIVDSSDHPCFSKQSQRHAEKELLPKTATRKSRPKPTHATAQRQTKIKKARITKPVTRKASSEMKATGSLSRKKGITSGSTISTLLANDETTTMSAEARDFGLEEAVMRRLDWTPIKDTKNRVGGSNDEQAFSPARFSSETDLGHRDIGALLGEFKLTLPNSNLAAISGPLQTSNTEGVVKRRKLDLVSALGREPLVTGKPKRSKSPRKKPQTITGKATAPFVLPQPEAGMSLLEYFPPPSKTKMKPAPKVASSAAPKKATKSKKSLAKAKTKEDLIVLLSPETAMKKARDQELVFGTSSQLVREESPTFLRDLQQAMRESDIPVEPQGKDHNFPEFEKCTRQPSTVLNQTPSRSLWSAAWRDLEEELLQAEVVDITHTPLPRRAPHFDQIKPDGQPDSKIEVLIDGSNNEPWTGNHKTSAGGNVQPTASANTLPCSVAESALQNRPKSRSPVKRGPSASSSTQIMPNYQGYSEAQLKKEVASYGFKAIKKREAMISLLERCWESQRITALQERPEAINHAQPVRSPSAKAAKVTHPTSKSLVPLPKRPRGRPKKDSSTAAQSTRKARPRKAVSSAIMPDTNVDDSATPRASPRRQRKSSKKLDESSLAFIQPASEELPQRKRAHSQHTQIFDEMTTMITMFRPTNEAGNLTWYEKILMYEPIVIEDLTAWLHQQSGGRVTNNKDGFEMVKKWCEARSVCCLWKENLRGGQRSRW